MKKGAKNQPATFDDFLKFALTKRGEKPSENPWLDTGLNPKSLSGIEHASDEALMERVAADLEGRETAFPLLGVATLDELSDHDLLYVLLLNIYETAHTCLSPHLTSVAVVFGTRFPNIKAGLERFPAFWVGPATDNPGWYNNLSNPVSIYLNSEGINLLAVAIDTRSPYAYLRWRCADGSWAIVPLPAYFEHLYRRGRP
jgi:hypothetical protein